MTHLSARTGTCEMCGAKLTHIIRLERINGDELPNVAPFSCPLCGHVGTLAGQAGQRIVNVDTKQYRNPLGRG
jgi:hypothetical protein